MVLSGGDSIGIVVLLGMALCLVLSYGAVDWVRQNHNIAPAIAFGTFALTGIVGGVISATVNNYFMGRYASPGMGFVMLWYAVGFAQITGEHKRQKQENMGCRPSGNGRSLLPVTVYLSDQSGI